MGLGLSSYFLSSERLYLREVRLSDVNETYYRWMNDPEVTQYLESRYYPNSLDRLKEYVRRLDGDPGTIFFAILLKEADRHIGNIKLGPINWIHRFGDIGILIGEKDLWGQGYATEAIQLVVHYAFNTLNLHRLTAGVYESNTGSIHAFERAGFSIESIINDYYFQGGRYQARVALGLVNSQQVKPDSSPA